MRRQLESMIERLVKGPVITKSAPVVEAALHDDLKRLRADLAGMVGSVIATRDGLLIAADLPSGITRNRMERKNQMPDLDLSLKELMSIDGALGAAVVDYGSGMALGTLGGSKALDLNVAAAGNTEVVRSKMRTIEQLGLKDTIEDIL